ncbi:hypothetical protein LY78DRAFT_216287 [Colletotrichum sublineola]|nr:hypothetical protein LY78DRAFT_216287 [Colletotrichum sublineola]
MRRCQCCQALRPHSSPDWQPTCSYNSFGTLLHKLPPMIMTHTCTTRITRAQSNPVFASHSSPLSVDRPKNALPKSSNSWIPYLSLPPHRPSQSAIRVSSACLSSPTINSAPLSKPPTLPSPGLSGFFPAASTRSGSIFNPSNTDNVNLGRHRPLRHRGSSPPFTAHFDLKVLLPMVDTRGGALYMNKLSWCHCCVRVESNLPP